MLLDLIKLKEHILKVAEHAISDPVLARLYNFYSRKSPASLEHERMNKACNDTGCQDLAYHRVCLDKGNTKRIAREAFSSGFKAEAARNVNAQAVAAK